MEGFLLIDKPKDMTSHDVVNRVRRLTGERRVGHAGTLDPFATGLLLVGVGRGATKQMQHLSGLDKTYEATFLLGRSSDTDDITGAVSHTLIPSHVSLEDVRAATHQFTGIIDQIPPQYSAIKIGGKKMYESARKGIRVDAQPRTVTIYDYTIQSMEAGEDKLSLSVTIHCSTGTYIRALARDLGEFLHTGGLVSTLRRHSIGPFTLKEAQPLNDLAPETVSEHLVPVDTILSKLA